MTIYKRKTSVTAADEAVADFSFQSDALAEMIVDAWQNKDFKDLLLNRDHAKALLATRGVYLSHPVVITEHDYFGNQYHQHDDDEVTFVLPNASRASPDAVPPGQNLLDTARLLMACIPNGI
jgi:hypothetical protein